MKKKLDQIGNSFRESLMKEVQSNNQELENKIDKVIKTYADSIKEMQLYAPQATASATLDFQSIMQEQRNKQLAEVNEQKIMQHIPWSGTNSAHKTEAKKGDDY